MRGMRTTTENGFDCRSEVAVTEQVSAVAVDKRLDIHNNSFWLSGGWTVIGNPAHYLKVFLY